MSTQNQETPEVEFGFKKPSPEEFARRKKQQEEFDESQRQQRIKDLRSLWGAPKRHVLFSPDNTGAWGETLTGLKARMGTGITVGLCSIRGNGKTQIGVELMKFVTEKEKAATYTTAAAFFTAIKETYRKDSSESEADVLASYRKPKLLVIDEFGKRSESEWEMTQLFELINNRYGDMTDTILIDNRSKSDFIATIGPSLSSRMLETGGIIEANWESFRK